ncbi:MAG: S8 family serine peptidase [Actinomycetota bacterium]|nr:S8 family serine peptidase [Actinomycetota bacterium]
MQFLRLIGGVSAAVLLTAGPSLAAPDPGLRAAWPHGSAVATYESVQALERALVRQPAQVVKRIPALRVAVLRPAGDVERFAARLAGEPGIASVERAAPRRSFVEPALVSPAGGAPLQWQYSAIKADQVPDAVAQAASAITIAVIDTGADLRAPDLAVKSPAAHSVRAGRGTDVTDINGHGTFVAALAAGSGSNGDGIAGVAGEAKLLVVQAGGPTGSFTDVEEAAAIVYAVDHGARILNLSLGGPATSTAERRAIEYAAAKGVLLIAAVGNSYDEGNPVEYPAALLQPLGSRGVGGRGLSVAASNRVGARAAFSSTGSHVSLAAPGAGVFSAVSSSSPASRYPRTPVPGSVGGLYGYGSGTSFAAPQVAGAAALVWAANPQLRADEVASILEETASGRGAWTPELGFGVIDVAAALARVQRAPAAPALHLDGRRSGSRVELAWSVVDGAASYQVVMIQNGATERVITPSTSATSASYDLPAGNAYAFSVKALDGAGAQLAVSPPWTVSLRRAAARISLSATRPGAQRVALSARLSVEGPPGAEHRRTVVLESFDGSSWSHAASAVTNSSGHAMWKYTLARGEYKIRARYAGTAEIAPAVSAALSLVVR